MQSKFCQMFCFDGLTCGTCDSCTKCNFALPTKPDDSWVVVISHIFCHCAVIVTAVDIVSSTLPGSFNGGQCAPKDLFIVSWESRHCVLISCTPMRHTPWLIPGVSSVGCNSTFPRNDLLLMSAMTSVLKSHARSHSSCPRMDWC